MPVNTPAELRNAANALYADGQPDDSITVARVRPYEINIIDSIFGLTIPTGGQVATWDGDTNHLDWTELATQHLSQSLIDRLLPEVTAADADKFAQVTSGGVWALADAPAGTGGITLAAARAAALAQIAAWAQVGNSDDIPQSKINANDLVHLLNTLVGNARLPYSAIDDTPTIPRQRTNHELRNLLFTGSAAQYTRGDGTFQTFPHIPPALTATAARDLIGVVSTTHAGLAPALPASNGGRMFFNGLGNYSELRDGIDAVIVHNDQQLTNAQNVLNHTPLIMIGTAFVTTNVAVPLAQRNLSVGDVFIWDDNNSVWFRIIHGGSVGSGLPAVTTANDGAALKVINGIWSIGVDQTGTGTTGITSVARDDTLAGDGTASSPLMVANPFTAAEKSKLATVDRNANPNPPKVQSSELSAGTGTQARLFSVADVNTLLAEYGEAFTEDDERKLDGIDPGAQTRVNADWDATSGDQQILNKPGNATMTAAGLVELATIAETRTGTDRTRAVTPDGIARYTGGAMAQSNRSPSAHERYVWARSATGETMEYVLVDTGQGSAHTMVRYLGISAGTTITDAALTTGATSTNDTDDTFALPTWGNTDNRYIWVAVPDETQDVTALEQLNAQGRPIRLADIPIQRIAGTRTLNGTAYKVWRSTDPWPGSSLSGHSVTIAQG